MPLTDLKVKNAKLKPGAKQSKFHDSKGLFLIIDKNERKIWQYRYEFAGEKSITFEHGYPDMSLSDARAERKRLEELITDCIDPSEERKSKKRSPGCRWYFCRPNMAAGWSGGATTQGLPAWCR